MPSPKLPIAGFAHLALAAQEDEGLHRRIITALRKEGLTQRGAELVPPAGATGHQVIAAITAAFQSAKHP